MEFVLWSSIVLHLLSYFSWVGGLLFLSGVLKPIFTYFGKESAKFYLPLAERFLGFTWMLVWTLIITGIILFLLGMRSNWWLSISTLEVLLFAHSIFIFVLIFISRAEGKMLKLNNENLDSEEKLIKFNKLNSFNVLFCFADIFTISGIIFLKWVQ